jgi:hypothetical protein
MTSHPNGSPLAIYLHDHLGAANSAVQMLETWRSERHGPEFKHFTVQLLAEVKKDRSELRNVIRAIGGSSHSWKEVAGWLAEKAALLKLRATGDADLAFFEGLELLALGVAGKRALWKMLSVVARYDDRLRRFDFRRLERTASAQAIAVQRQRLAAGRKAFVRK